MCDDWYRGLFDGACFGVLQASHLRPMTTPRYDGKHQANYRKTRKQQARRLTHYDYGGIAFCQVGWARRRQVKTPLLTHKEEAITCSRCLDKFGRQDTTNRGHGE